MGERPAQDDRIAAIDRIFRELTWHGQKHAIHTLTRPEIGLTMPQMITLLSIYDSGKHLLLTSNHGDIIAVQSSTGGVCNTTRIYGSNRSREWHSLDDDGVLRVYVADQIIGLQWQKFLMACV